MEPLAIEKLVMKEHLKENDTELLRITIAYPRIRSPKTPSHNHINQYYEKAAQKLLKYSKEALLPMQKEAFSYAKLGKVPFRTGELFLTYEIALQDECILSLFFDQYEFLGGAHGSTDRFSQTWNLQTGELVALKSCFVSPTYYKEDIIEMIRLQVMKQIDQGETKYYKECFIDIEHMFKETNFYLTDKGVTIYFQQYEIGPYASGIPEFILPYSDAIKLIQCKD